MNPEDHPNVQGPLPTEDSDAFRYWSARGVLSDAALSQSLNVARECIRSLRSGDIGYTDETFTRVVLEPSYRNEKPS